MRLLRTIRDRLIPLLPADEFDESLTWRHCKMLHTIDVAGCSRNTCKIPLKFVVPVLRAARSLLLPAREIGASGWSDWQWRDTRWNNTQATPPVVWGDYIWTYSTGMIQELLWLYPEFVAGYKFATSKAMDARGCRHRDENPYKDVCRAGSWDKGYILGLHERHHHGASSWAKRLRKAVTA